MKKQSLWLIVGVMLIAFIGLLYMQVGYIRVVYQSRDAQFDAAVREALIGVNNDLERDEIARIVNKELGVPAPMVQDLLNTDQKKKEFDTAPKLRVPAPSSPFERKGTVREEDRIAEMSKMLQDRINDRYQNIRQAMLELAMDLAREGNSIPIYERITTDQLETSLASHLSNVGIAIPYIYNVNDSRGSTYFSSGEIPSGDDEYGVYQMPIFKNDSPSRQNYLRLYFPGKRSYLTGSIDFLIPSVIFTILLFITFTYTIYTLFRQKKLEEMRKDFINNMTHELKTPVSSIKLGSEMLSDADTITNETLRTRTISNISAAAERLSKLIEKVLQMSFFDDENNRPSLNFKPIDLEEIIIEVTSHYSMDVENAGGILNVELDASETEILGDEMHLSNIIYNLLENAMKYRRPDVLPEITVSLSNEKEWLVVDIKDNGRGIKKEYLGKIFDRFFRVPTGNRHNTKGFGLGLAYVARMVRSHNGTITADSKVGAGTVFEIKLPLLKNK